MRFYELTIKLKKMEKKNCSEKADFMVDSKTCMFKYLSKPSKLLDDLWNANKAIEVWIPLFNKF